MTNFFCSFFEERTHYNHLQLYGPAFNSYLSFPTHDVLATVSAPGRIFSSLSHSVWSLHTARKWAGTASPHVLPLGKAPRAKGEEWIPEDFLAITKGDWWKQGER